MSMINCIHNATIFMLLLGYSTQIQAISLIFEIDVNQPIDHSVIHLAEHNNRNPFRRPKVPGGGQLRIIDEMNQTKT